MKKPIIIIPAFNPPANLQAVISGLSNEIDTQIILINDGSDYSFASSFANFAKLPNVTLLKHAVNLGKGAALKTAFNYILCSFDLTKLAGVITLDADGQHLIKDVKNIYNEFIDNPNSLILGVRKFKQAGVPLKNRLGNIFIRQLFKVIYKKKLQDTQTGLRAIPTKILPELLKIKTNGYEFEFKMLVIAIFKNISIREIDITTVYLEDNSSSHFKPFIDSIKILTSLI